MNWHWLIERPTTTRELIVARMVQALLIVALIVVGIFFWD